MSKQVLIFDKQRVRSALDPDNYQELLQLFGSDQIDKICCSLLSDSIEINKDRKLNTCSIEAVILRHVEPENYLSPIEVALTDETGDCRDFTPQEFNAVYSGICKINDYVDELLPSAFYNHLECIEDAKVIKRLYSVTAEIGHE